MIYESGLVTHELGVYGTVLAVKVVEQVIQTKVLPNLFDLLLYYVPGVNCHQLSFLNILACKGA